MRGVLRTPRILHFRTPLDFYSKICLNPVRTETTNYIRIMPKGTKGKRGPIPKNEDERRERTRITLDLTENFRKRLISLAAMDDSSIKGAILRAVIQREQVLEHEKSGGKVVFRDADGTETIVRFL